MDEELAEYLMEEDFQERVLAIQERPRTITKDWDIPEHVKSRPIIDIETNDLI